MIALCFTIDGKIFVEFLRFIAQIKLWFMEMLFTARNRGEEYCEVNSMMRDSSLAPLL